MKNLVLNNPWVTKEVSKIKKYFKFNVNENKNIKIFGMQVKLCLKGNLQQLNAYIKKDHNQ